MKMTQSSKWLIWAIKISIILFVVLLQFNIPQEDINLLVVDISATLGENFFLYILLAYAIALALPYFPGVELGLAIIVIFREKGVLFVYVTTILGLVFSFIIGRYLSRNNHHPKYLKSLLSSEIVGKLSRYSPVALLALLLNVPGNIALGGGGGVAMSYGLLGTISLIKFIATISIAITPVPILFFLGFTFGGL